MSFGGLSRLLELFEGPEAPGPWAPPALTAALHALLPWRAFDESSELYVNAGSVGYSYGANTIRDGVSLTPRRELRALALPSEIMRLANLEGYLKFPGPFPVASIRLKYVPRPAAAERFVPREEAGAAPDARPAGAADAGDACGDAVPDREDTGIPEPAGLDGAGLADAPNPADMPPEPASWQGELDLVPLPGEAGDSLPDAAATITTDGKAPESRDKAPEAGPGPAAAPGSSDAGGCGSDWG